METVVDEELDRGLVPAVVQRFPNEAKVLVHTARHGAALRFDAHIMVGQALHLVRPGRPEAEVGAILERVELSLNGTLRIERVLLDIAWRARSQPRLVAGGSDEGGIS